ncbi:hypothetical protein BDV37DRAFT_100279 [Aspergillus pseudonomiae]|uniref:Uncharacterized protein n=1 Tax=Aspergillus pseudonomiae TaxID=1506151 RepID=A0A5N7DEW7_9EURO|nr:uncharacterized protein BDV37DRAFT_100279 [Aspergillus pseudonomiae]KAE8404950.1 hypothetical protein BDV37DRAFT_100279 [Aspergillus pseudonomiae]
MGNLAKPDSVARVTNARQRGLEIKKLQEEALAQLPLNTLYIVLYIRSDPPRANDFHWGYYFHQTTSGGSKYHMRNLGGGWIPDHGPTSGVFKSNFLCVLIQIANVPEPKHAILDQTMRSRDDDVNQIPGVTCRIWLMTILQRLIEEGLVRCDDHQKLQDECMMFGNQYSATAASNSQPRPVVRSKLCK